MLFKVNNTITNGNSNWTAVNQFVVSDVPNYNSAVPKRMERNIVETRNDSAILICVEIEMIQKFATSFELFVQVSLILNVHILRHAVMVFSMKSALE